jgi:beta-lactamase class A
VRESRRPTPRGRLGTIIATVLAYYAKNLESGLTLAANERAVLPSWSTIKVLLALAFWRAVEEERLSAGHAYAFQPWQSVGGSGVLRGFRHAARITLADLVHLSLAVSDNDAANIVLAFVGLEPVNDLAAELGLEDTAMRRRMMDAAARAEGRDNVTSARDLGLLFEELERGAVFSERVRAQVRASLAAQEHRDGIARYLPAEATYLGKVGDDAPEGRYAHDAALVVAPEARLVIVVMGDGIGGYEPVSRLGSSLYGALLS